MLLQFVLFLLTVTYTVAQQYPSKTALYTSASTTQPTGVSYQQALATTTQSGYFNLQLLCPTTNTPTVSSAIVHYQLNSNGQQNVAANAENNNFVYTVPLQPGDIVIYSFTYFLSTGPAYDTKTLTLQTATAPAATPAVTTTAAGTTTIKPTTLRPTTTLTVTTARITTTPATTTVKPTTVTPTTAVHTTVSPTTPTYTVAPSTTAVPTTKATQTPQGPFGTNLIWSDEFNTLDLAKWKHAITASGGGNWEFEYYVNNRSNSYVNDSILYIQPTLTSITLGSGLSPSSIQTGTVDLSGFDPASICTSGEFYGCVRSGNTYNPFNPIQSASIRTAESFSFKYGRVETRARLPLGDWIWPAIWLLPVNEQYGTWPASGEIDIMESRGNGASYPVGGVNQFGSTIHFGPFAAYDGHQYLSTGYQLKSGLLSDDFHIYGLYWDATGIYTYIDNDSNRVLQQNWTTEGTLWNRFPYWQNENYANPWQAGNGGTVGAPFDQEFYLIFNVAVGGTNGYFPLGDYGTYSSIVDFVNQQANWYSTWNNGTTTSNAMAIDWIRVYQ